MAAWRLQGRCLLPPASVPWGISILCSLLQALFLQGRGEGCFCSQKDEENINRQKAQSTFLGKQRCCQLQLCYAHTHTSTQPSRSFKSQLKSQEKNRLQSPDITTQCLFQLSKKLLFLCTGDASPGTVQLISLKQVTFLF